MHFEFFGLPGIGKTTLALAVSKNEKINTKYDAIASKPLNSLANEQIKLFLYLNKSYRKQLRLYDSWAYETMRKNKWIQIEVHKLNLYFAEFLSQDLEEPHQLPLIHRAIERDYIFYLMARNQGIDVIEDDGIIQKLVSIFGLRKNSWVSIKSEIFIKNILSLFDTQSLMVIFDPLKTIDTFINNSNNSRESYLLDKKDFDYIGKRAILFLENLLELMYDTELKVTKLSSTEFKEKKILLDLLNK